MYLIFDWLMADYFLPHFKAQGVPYTAVFDARLRLQEVLRGEADAARLVQAIH